jgi:hypothetical protein
MRPVLQFSYIHTHLKSQLIIFQTCRDGYESLRMGYICKRKVTSATNVCHIRVFILKLLSLENNEMFYKCKSLTFKLFKLPVL